MCLLQVKKLLTNGTGDFDDELIRHKWPQELGISEQRVLKVILAQVQDRRRDMLVQAVSSLRQKKLDDTVKGLNTWLPALRWGSKRSSACFCGRQEIDPVPSWSACCSLLFCPLGCSYGSCLCTAVT